MATVTLRPGRDTSLLRHHPWVFSGAVASVDGSPGLGETVEVHAADGRPLGRGAWSPRSQIRVRMWTFDPSEEMGPELIRSRLERALACRPPCTDTPSGRRLVHGESDGLPGLIVDRYGDFLVCQLLSAGAERWKAEIVDALREIAAPSGIWERSDAEVRTKEGLSERRGLLWGEEPPELIEIVEGPCRHLVDPREGHKTGFYLDQRRNRAEVAELVAAGALGENRAVRVLNCFAYAGAFGHAVLAATKERPGAVERVTHVEASADALEILNRNARLNDFPEDAIETIEGNVFSILRGFRAEERQFDLVILDPPKFADSRHRLDSATRGYKDINLLAFQLLAPGGLLATFSCSGALQSDLFQKIVADAALDAGRDARLLRRLTQADDHPVGLAFPEGRYLKGMICRVF